MVTTVRDVIRRLMPVISGIVIGGDLNTNPDQAMFEGEKTLGLLGDQGFRNCFGPSPFGRHHTPSKPQLS